MRTAVQLQPFRTLDLPIPELLDRVAAAGFDGVEFMGLGEKQLKPIAEAFNRTGLKPVAAHVPLDRLQGDRKQVVRELKTIGCERVVVPHLHDAYFDSETEINRMATRLSALGGRLAADNRRLCYHNGTYELEVATGDAGGSAFERLVGRAGDGLAFELDVGAVVATDRDPVDLLSGLDGRVPLVQFRDVDAHGDPVELGEGYLDLESVAAAADDAGADWLVYEHDDPAYPIESLEHGAAVLADLLD